MATLYRIASVSSNPFKTEPTTESHLTYVVNLVSRIAPEEDYNVTKQSIIYRRVSSRK